MPALANDALNIRYNPGALLALTAHPVQIVMDDEADTQSPSL